MVNNKVYIGKTELTKVKTRWVQHRSYLRRNKHHSFHLQQSWNKYGEENFNFEVIEQFNPDMNFDINNLERYWIKQYDSTNPVNGYNRAPGGEGHKGMKLSPERINKIIEYSNRPEIKQRMYNNNPMHNPETVKKVSGDNNSSKRPEVREKIRKSQIKKMKPIRCVQTGERFESIASAARTMCVFKQHIMQQLKGICKQVKGFTYEYV